MLADQKPGFTTSIVTRIGRTTTPADAAVSFSQNTVSWMPRAADAVANIQMSRCPEPSVRRRARFTLNADAYTNNDCVTRHVNSARAQQRCASAHIVSLQSPNDEQTKILRQAGRQAASKTTHAAASLRGFCRVNSCTANFCASACGSKPAWG